MSISYSVHGERFSDSLINIIKGLNIYNYEFNQNETTQSINVRNGYK